MPPGVISLYFQMPWVVGNIGLALVQLCRRDTAASDNPDRCFGITIAEAYGDLAGVLGHFIGNRESLVDR